VIGVGVEPHGIAEDELDVRRGGDGKRRRSTIDIEWILIFSGTIGVAPRRDEARPGSRTAGVAHGQLASG
jgi:hypothetical protein